MKPFSPELKFIEADAPDIADARSGKSNYVSRSTGSLRNVRKSLSHERYDESSARGCETCVQLVHQTLILSFYPWIRVCRRVGSLLNLLHELFYFFSPHSKFVIYEGG